MKLFRLSGVIMMAGVVVGCGAQTSVTSAWQDPRATHASFQHLLVVGVSPNSRTRRSFEEAMAAAIAGKPSAERTKASASIQAVDSAEELSPQMVAAMVKATGADGVLITRLASRKVALKKTPSRTETKDERPSLSDTESVADVFRHEYNDYEEPGELVAKSKVVVDTSLYDVADGNKLLYTITTKCEFVEDRDDVIAAVTSAIARQLRSDGLIH